MSDYPQPGILSEPFGTVHGETVTLYTLSNGKGMVLKACDYGCIVTHLFVPDRAGQPGDVVLGHDTLQGYLDYSPFFGAAIGRYANRIGGATFTLDGHTFALPMNNGPNTLHGGVHGFHDRLWRAEPFMQDGMPGLRFTRTSPDGEEGFPGTLAATVEYRLSADNALRIDFHATADAPCPVAMTHHGYFNLTGDDGADILGHELSLNAARYTPVDETLIPTGERAPVAGTPFDFTTAKPVGRDIDADDGQLRLGGGYDHNFVIDREGKGLVPAARLADPVSGRVMRVETSEPGLQFYTGNHLEADKSGKGRRFAPRSGLCLETQAFPNSPNEASFPDTILRPGDEYRSTTIYRFSIA